MISASGDKSFLLYSSLNLPASPVRMMFLSLSISTSLQVIRLNMLGFRRLPFPSVGDCEILFSVQCIVAGPAFHVCFLRISPGYVYLIRYGFGCGFVLLIVRRKLSAVLLCCSVNERQVMIIGLHGPYRISFRSEGLSGICSHTYIYK